MYLEGETPGEVELAQEEIEILDRFSFRPKQWNVTSFQGRKIELNYSIFYESNPVSFSLKIWLSFALGQKKS